MENPYPTTFHIEVLTNDGTTTWNVLAKINRATHEEALDRANQRFDYFCNILKNRKIRIVSSYPRKTWKQN